MEGDRYRLTGDLRYFAHATTDAELPDPWPRFREQLEAHCEAEEASYLANRDAFRRGQFGPQMIIDQLGGQPGEGNWYYRGGSAYAFPVEYDDDGIWPISAVGNRFWFVAEVPGWMYRRSGADGILLFFEPVERLALLTFDWS